MTALLEPNFYISGEKKIMRIFQKYLWNFGKDVSVFGNILTGKKALADIPLATKTDFF